MHHPLHFGWNSQAQFDENAKNVFGFIRSAPFVNIPFNAGIAGSSVVMAIGNVVKGTSISLQELEKSTRPFGEAGFKSLIPPVTALKDNTAVKKLEGIKDAIKIPEFKPIEFKPIDFSGLAGKFDFKPMGINFSSPLTPAQAGEAEVKNNLLPLALIVGLGIIGYGVLKK